ncbi:glycosyltransferase [Paenibacillus alvei]|uniref:glycosyltransferase n=1 Tax=Paenibacillus alvei TaxID=44250 RepID=UPI002281B921|nr:glycosyltransferase [Paenibacillus alvei]
MINPVPKYYDIIIPIYNAYEELVECVESVMKNTDYEYRLILIDDCSPDKRIREYLNLLNKKHNQIVALYNEENLGFVSTVNKGMEYSDSDVILLNSDTEVTPRWLSNLNKCAYSSKNIATVTPFTNNGTICSVPLFGQDNPIPDGYTTDEFAQMIESISMNKYPVLPTAVGFCMLIKREVLNKIGLFDDINFAKGYGEENDFCCRVMENGYLNVLADNVFVYHKGSMSFKEEKAELIRKNSETLKRKFPYYFDRVEQFLRANDVFPLVENVQKRMKTHSTDIPKILYIIHNTIDEDWINKRGGTEFHVADLKETLSNKYSFYTLTINGTRVLLKEYRGDQVQNYNFYLRYPIETHTFYSDEYKELVEKIITSFNIDIVHIHHFLRQTFDILDVCEMLNVPVIFTAHDYHLICPSVLLLDEKGNYCFDIKSQKKCQECLHYKMGYFSEFREIWKHNVLDIFKKIKLFIFPSRSVHDYFQKEYNFDELNVEYTIIEHGITKYLGKKNTPAVEHVFNVAFVGSFALHKGSDIIVDIINHTSPSSGINYYLFGEVHDPVVENIQKSNVFKMGAYKRDSIGTLLNESNIHLVCLFSLVPETFSFTLSEAWSAGVPVLVNDRGALGTRVNDGVNGWKINDLNASTIVTRINNLFKDTIEYDKVKSYVLNASVPEVNEVSKKYDRLYQNMLEPRNINNEVRRVLTNEEIYTALNNINSSNQHLERALKMKEQELQTVYNTLGWRFINYTKKHKITAKYGKKILIFLLKFKNR